MLKGYKLLALFIVLLSRALIALSISNIICYECKLDCNENDVEMGTLSRCRARSLSLFLTDSTLVGFVEVQINNIFLLFESMKIDKRRCRKT